MDCSVLLVKPFFVTFQYKLARCPRAEMHRGVADLVYNIRIPRIA